LGRRCFGLELDPRYADVAVRRWEQFTGKQAVRVEAACISSVSGAAR
jgi:DNA modification methylase